MFGPKIKIEPGLYERLKQTAATAGYSSVDEFVIHILEQAAAQSDHIESEEEVRKRLQGLGYID